MAKRLGFLGGLFGRNGKKKLASSLETLSATATAEPPTADLDPTDTPEASEALDARDDEVLTLGRRDPDPDAEIDRAELLAALNTLTSPPRRQSEEPVDAGNPTNELLGEIRPEPTDQPSAGTANRLDASDESKPVTVKRRSSKQEVLQKIEEGYDEMIGVVRSVKDHMAKQGERQERLLEMLDGLPEAIKSLPQTMRNQTDVLELLHEELKRQGVKDERLASALEGVAKSQETSDKTMNAIHTQLNVQAQTNSSMLEGFQEVNGSLENLTQRNEATVDAVAGLAEKTKQSDATVKELFERSQRQITVMSVVSWTLAIVALTVAAAVAMNIGKMAGG